MPLVLTGLLISASTSQAAEPEAVGEALYAEKCAACHGKRGVHQILRQRSPKARKRALGGSHLRYHVPEEAARASVVEYLLHQLGK